jgi:hypothetical protein
MFEKICRKLDWPFVPVDTLMAQARAQEEASVQAAMRSEKRREVGAP